MQLKQLQFFVVSVDMGSFMSAARVLYTTQPHISKTIKALEEELGLSLLNRQAKGVVMTDDGHKVYDYASQILQNADMIRSLQRERVYEKLGVAIGSCPCMAALFHDFCKDKNYENRRFVYSEGTVEEVMQQLHRNSAEIGFVSISCRQFHIFQKMLDHRRLRFTLIKECMPMLFVGAGHPLYSASRVTLTQIQGLKIVQSKEEYFSLIHHLGHINDDFGSLEKACSAVVTDCDSLIYRFLEDGELAALGSSLDVEDYAKHKIRGIAISSEDEGILFGYMERKRDGLSSLGMSFADYVTERIAGNLEE